MPGGVLPTTPLEGGTRIHLFLKNKQMAAPPQGGASLVTPLPARVGAATRHAVHLCDAMAHEVVFF